MRPLKKKLVLPNKKKTTVDVFNHKVKILDLLKGDMLLVEVGWNYGKNESSICISIQLYTL
jgi:hypothetical protein